MNVELFRKNLKVFLSAGVLAPFIGLVLWLAGFLGFWLIITSLYVSALFATGLLDWKGQLSTSLKRTALGWVGGVAVIVSIALPWRIWIVNGISYSSSPVDAGPISMSVLPLELTVVGGLLSMISRFGGLVTTYGISSWMSIPTWESCPFSGCPTIMIGPGFWLAVFGIGISLAGRPLNMPLMVLKKPNTPTTPDRTQM